MNHLKHSFFMVLLLSLSFLAQAEKVQESSVNDLMVLSGLNSQLAELAPTLISMIQQSMPDLSAEKKKQMETVFGKVFNPDLILKDVSSELSKSLSEADAKKVIAWYESNTGARIARAEEAAFSPQAMMEFQKVAPELMKDTELMATVQELMDATGIIEKSLEIQEISTLATLIGMSQARNPDQPVNLDALKQMVSMQLEKAKGSIEQMMALQLAFSYKDIDKASMQEYLQVLKSPAMQKFNNSNIEGSRIALNNALDRLLAAE